MQLKLFNSEVMIKYTKLKNLCYSSLCWTLPFAWKVSVIKSSELVILGGVHRMNKFLMAGIVAAMAAATSVATASPLVTANVMFAPAIQSVSAMSSWSATMGPAVKPTGPAKPTGALVHWVTCSGEARTTSSALK